MNFNHLVFLLLFVSCQSYVVNSGFEDEDKWHIRSIKKHNKILNRLQNVFKDSLGINLNEKSYLVFRPYSESDEKYASVYVEDYRYKEFIIKNDKIVYSDSLSMNNIFMLNAFDLKPKLSSKEYKTCYYNLENCAGDGYVFYFVKDKEKGIIKNILYCLYAVESDKAPVNVMSYQFIAERLRNFHKGGRTDYQNYEADFH